MPLDPIWARWIQLSLSHSVQISILILFADQRLRLPSATSLRLPTKFFHSLYIFLMRATFTTHLILLEVTLAILTTLGRDDEASSQVIFSILLLFPVSWVQIFSWALWLLTQIIHFLERETPSKTQAIPIISAFILYLDAKQGCSRLSSVRPRIVFPLDPWAKKPLLTLLSKLTRNFTYLQQQHIHSEMINNHSRRSNINFIEMCKNDYSYILS